MHVFDARVLNSCVLAVLFMQSSVQNMLMAYPSLQASSVALAKLDSLGLSVSAVATEASSETSFRKSSDIELRGVTHEYRGEEDDSVFSLGPIDLVLHAGEIVFVVGGNGSGKSTLVKVLTGLYVPQSGEDPGRRTPRRRRDAGGVPAAVFCRCSPTGTSSIGSTVSRARRSERTPRAISRSYDSRRR